MTMHVRGKPWKAARITWVLGELGCAYCGEPIPHPTSGGHLWSAGGHLWSARADNSCDFRFVQCRECECWNLVPKAMRRPAEENQ